jgi:hypothetical protein
MRVEVETLTDFRNKVNALLQSLDAGHGSVKSISALVMGADHLGTGFDEATQLFARYTETHAKLQQLSQTLTDTIDAMSISIDVAQKGYQNVEATQIAELWKIRDQQAQAAQPPAAPTSGSTGTSTTSNNSSTNSGQHHGM